MKILTRRYAMPSIAYTATTTPFGEMLLAATDAGVVALSFGNRQDELATWLQKEFPTRTIVRDDAGLRDTLAAALDVFEGSTGNTIPLAPVGSEFQWAVWIALRGIPFGETRTYTQLAAMVGRPHAVRAVASACANNPISLLVPCHRVVGADGSLRGYRWGLERKQQLLEHEKRTLLTKLRPGVARSA
jgi:AraC family transcriptional regulator of adaptative response/methylated-DNA-[protein]-cysteine methyltransferase